MNDDVDMRHYGGLRTEMRLTFWTFLFGYLAIIGFPGTAGYFSKDKIIEAAFGQNVWVGLAALVGAGITAFYMTRLVLMTFFTKPRWEKDVHPHESPLVMTVPLMILGGLSLVGGLMMFGWIGDWLAPVVGAEEHHDLPIPVWAIIALTLTVVAIGVGIAWMLVERREVPREAPQDVSFVTRAARADLYGDAINDTLVVEPGAATVRALTAIDEGVVDGAVEGGALAVAGAGSRLRRLQNGFVRSYALMFLGGVLLVALSLMAVTLA